MSDFKPGDVVAHKSNPGRPWAVPHVEVGGGLYCVFVGATGEPVEWEFPAEALVPYADGVYDLFDRLTAAVGDDRKFAAVVVAIQDAHDEYLKLDDSNNGD